MRLSHQEVHCIVRLIKLRDSEAKVYLFGSRVNDQLRGGDIDLLVISSVIEFGDKIDILSELKAELGDQKIDLTLCDPHRVSEDDFARNAVNSGVELTGINPFA